MSTPAGGITGTSTRVIARASPRRMRTGTSWVPMIGMVISMEATRNRGSNTWATMPSIAARSISMG